MSRAVSGVRSWCEASAAKSRSAASDFVMSLGAAGETSETRSSSAMPESQRLEAGLARRRAARAPHELRDGHRLGAGAGAWRQRRRPAPTARWRPREHARRSRRSDRQVGRVCASDVARRRGPLRVDRPRRRRRRGQGAADDDAGSDDRDDGGPDQLLGAPAQSASSARSKRKPTPRTVAM